MEHVLVCVEDFARGIESVCVMRGAMSVQPAARAIDSSGVSDTAGEQSSSPDLQYAPPLPWSQPHSTAVRKMSSAAGNIHSVAVAAAGAVPSCPSTGPAVCNLSIISTSLHHSKLWPVVQCTMYMHGHGHTAL
jgi:hypothetical protein